MSQYCLDFPGLFVVAVERAAKKARGGLGLRPTQFSETTSFSKPRSPLVRRGRRKAVSLPKFSWDKAKGPRNMSDDMEELENIARLIEPDHKPGTTKQMRARFKWAKGMIGRHPPNFGSRRQRRPITLPSLSMPTKD